MAKKKSKAPVLKLVTPKGQLMFPWLFKPDTRFNSEGVFKTELVLDLNDPEVKKLVKEIKEFHKESGAGPRLPYIVDKDAGTVTLRCKTMEPPAVVDAKKNRITKDPSVGNGTVAKIAVSIAPYEQQGGGLTCYIRAVQIIDLVVYEPGIDAFDVEEGYKDDSDGDDAAEDDAQETEEQDDGDEEF